jgi:hypothetical protein
MAAPDADFFTGSARWCLPPAGILRYLLAVASRADVCNGPSASAEVAMIGSEPHSSILVSRRSSSSSSAWFCWIFCRAANASRLTS